jgi:hypothetical protein
VLARAARTCHDHGDLRGSHGQARLDEEVLPLALADGQDSGEAAEEDVAVEISTDEPLTGPARTARRATVTTPTPASSSSVSSIPAAAVGITVRQPGSASRELHRQTPRSRRSSRSG